MTKITCSRIFHFDSAHRIEKHEGKCKMLHGHRYVLEVFFVNKDTCENSNNLDYLGRVIDFSVVKEIINNWINSNLDHNVILAESDNVLGDSITKSTQQKIYYLTNQPTAENIALHLFNLIIPNLLKETTVKCCKVRIYETPNCFVEVG